MCQQNLSNRDVFVGLPACTHFCISAHKFSFGLRSGFCDGYSYTLILSSISHFATNFEVCVDNVHLEDPF